MFVLFSFCFEAQIANVARKWSLFVNSVVFDKILQALEAGGAEVAAVGSSVVVRVGHVRFEFGERHFRLFDAQVALDVAPVPLFGVISVAAAAVPRPPRLHRALRVLRRARRHRRKWHDRNTVRTVCIKRLFRRNPAHVNVFQMRVQIHFRIEFLMTQRANRFRLNRSVKRVEERRTVVVTDFLVCFALLRFD